MTTRMFLANDNVPYSPATKRGAWDTTVGFVDNLLSRRKRGQSTTKQTAETNVAANYDVMLGRFVSEPLAAQTVAGNLSYAIPCRETNAGADDILHLHIFVTAGDSDTVRGTLLADYVANTTEFVVNASTFDVISGSSISLSSVSASAGDRIVVEVGYRSQSADATSYTGAFKYGGLTADATAGQTAITAGSESAASWIEFDSDLTFTYSYLYTSSDAGPVTPGAIRGTWDETASFDDYKLTQTPSGSRQTKTKSETVATNPYDMLAQRFVSDQLAAQTINADIVIEGWAYESSASADMFNKFHLYVMKPDGTVRGTLLSNVIAGSELSSINQTRQEAAQTPSSVSAQDGDRLVLEVGNRSTNASTTNFTATYKAGGAASEMSAGMGIASETDSSGWLQFRQVLAWYTAPTTHRKGQAVMVM